ncbi:hypothetical protein [Pseudonocardia sp. HH130630-07]|uniref:hypothetical protein n=1 Tax=Pseudonocardia sp. HH130630-07 TaxID=1690815 RepID=UPI000814F637|nr:hypothetical protein [Pseudonocardia sp. HH130630-07]ANY05113.1 hypothetical protein AFB00_00880 [Pseudonocardia sp. HH130630-07]
MDAARDRDDRPDDEFESIVAGWRDEGSVPDWPDPGESTGPTAHADPAAPAVQPGERPGHRPGPAAEIDSDEGHYHPPDPPPLPRPGPPAVVGGGLIVFGVLLCVAPSVLGVGGTWPLPLGLVLVAAGLTWLVLRLWTPDHGDDAPDPDDDGSRI